MATPLRITFVGTDPSDALERRVRSELGKLERFHPRMTECHVTLEARSGHHRHGTWAVRIALLVPGGEVVIDHDSGGDEADEDPFVTLQDAFVGARRALLNDAQRVRGEVKTDAAARDLADADAELARVRA